MAAGTRPAASAARRFDDPDAPPRTLADAGERRVLDGILARTPMGFGVLIGPGDDAAVLQPPPETVLVVTQDAVVEDVDFQRSWARPWDVGVKAVAISLSDLAAMGASPLGCVVTLCAPPSTRLVDLEAIHGGILEEAGARGCPLVGGDLSRTSGPIVVDVCALGSVAPARTLRRDAGRPGDLLVVTGRLGRAAAGLRLLEAGTSPGDPLAATSGITARWWRAQMRPEPRLEEGRALAAAGVHCAGDISDGLVADATRTASASGCAAELWAAALPVDPELEGRFGEEWLALATAGGEDFELLAAVPPAVLTGLLQGWPVDLEPLTVVGRLVGGAGVRLLEGDGGGEMPIPAARFEHFG